MKNKISVGEIIRYLYYLDKELSGFRVPEKIMGEGRWYHQRFGFNQPEIFQRYYKYYDKEGVEWWIVRGCPDRIEIEDDKLYVDELKTVRSRPKSEALEIGSTQGNIYAWLVGSEFYRVYLYDVKEGVMEKYVFEFDRKKAKRDIKKGIRIKKKLNKFKDFIESNE